MTIHPEAGIARVLINAGDDNSEEIATPGMTRELITLHAFGYYLEFMARGVIGTHVLLCIFVD